MLSSTHCIIRIRHPFPRGVWVAMMWQHQHWCWFRFQIPFQSIRPCTNVQTQFHRLSSITPSHIVTTNHHQRPSLINFSIISSVPPPRDPFSRNIQKFSFSLILLPTWLSHTFLKSHTLFSSLSLSFLCHPCIHTFNLLSMFLPTILPTSQSIKSSVCLPSIPSHKFPPSVPAENYKLLLATSIPPLRKIGNTCPFTNNQLA